MPLAFCFARSFSLIVVMRLRSSFSVAIWRQRVWNSHAGQCLLRISGGGAALALCAVSSATSNRASSTSFGRCTVVVVYSGPWMIFVAGGVRPGRGERGGGSKTTGRLSHPVGFSIGRDRKGAKGGR